MSVSDGSANLNISYPHNFHREFDDFELMLS